MENKEYDLIIKRSKRKTMSLRILPSKTLEISAPYNTPKKYIYDFIQKKKNWINRVFYSLNEKLKFKQLFDFENYIYIYGEKNTKIDNFNYKTFSKNALPLLIKQISNIIGYKYSNIKIKNSKRIWGSFSSNQEIMLNYKCIILPKELINYIIIHELCHGKQMNHSPKFWANVKIFCPNYKELKKQLTKYDFILKDPLIL